MEQTADAKGIHFDDRCTCDECGEQLGRGAWITLVEDKGALC